MSLALVKWLHGKSAFSLILMTHLIVNYCFSIQLLVSLFEVVAFGSGTSTSHQMQFKKLLKQIFEVYFLAWGITEDTFLNYLLIFSGLI